MWESTDRKWRSSRLCTDAHSMYSIKRGGVYRLEENLPTAEGTVMDGLCHVWSSLDNWFGLTGSWKLKQDAEIMNLCTHSSENPLCHQNSHKLNSRLIIYKNKPGRGLQLITNYFCYWLIISVFLSANYDASILSNIRIWWFFVGLDCKWRHVRTF